MPQLAFFFACLAILLTAIFPSSSQAQTESFHDQQSPRCATTFLVDRT